MSPTYLPTSRFLTSTSSHSHDALLSLPGVLAMSPVRHAPLKWPVFTTALTSAPLLHLVALMALLGFLIGLWGLGRICFFQRLELYLLSVWF